MNNAGYRVTSGVRLRRFLLRITVRFLFRLLGTVAISGWENIPRGQTYVVAANHVSIFDPPLVLAFWPEILEAIGAVDVFDKPFQGPMLRMYGTVPVHRGEYDRKLIDTMLAMLRSGRRLLIAPEGGRSHGQGLRLAKPGVSYILDEAQVPVVPVGIVGTTDDYMRRALHFRRPRVEIHVGRPFLLPRLAGRGAERRLARQQNADLVMQHIAGLLPPAYRGVYADTAIFPSETD